MAARVCSRRVESSRCFLIHGGGDDFGGGFVLCGPTHVPTRNDVIRCDVGELWCGISWRKRAVVAGEESGQVDEHSHEARRREKAASRRRRDGGGASGNRRRRADGDGATGGWHRR